MDWISFGLELPGGCEHGNEASSFIKCGEYLLTAGGTTCLAVLDGKAEASGEW